jgi:hypothetical protein
MQKQHESIMGGGEEGGRARERKKKTFEGNVEQNETLYQAIMKN